MSYTYVQRKHSRAAGQSRASTHAEPPAQDLSALKAGTAKPDAAQKGRPIDMGAAMREKMENAFGDLSAVRLYESPAVDEAGAEAVAMGSEIAFAPGMADFTTRAGQERLGHELSHVAQQRAGAVSRSAGFLNDSALEAQADRAGAMAAAGQPLAMPVAALSTASAASSAGPMQAKKKKADDGQRITAGQQADAGERASAGDLANVAERASEGGRASVADRAANAHLEEPLEDPSQLRPWELSEEHLKANHFNPTGNDELQMQLDQIDQANSAQMAYSYFSTFAGNGTGQMLKGRNQRWDPKNMDLGRFKAKLKNMMRMVHDFPELQGMIGNMHKTTGDTLMAAGNTFGGRRAANLDYNADYDRKGPWASFKRFIDGTLDKISGHAAAPDEYAGTHELGHVLNSLLLDSEGDPQDVENDWASGDTAGTIVEEVLNKPGVLKNPADIAKMKRYKKTDYEEGYAQGKIDPDANNFRKKGLTSGYGETSNAEFFAEAFADVYAHGKKARKASIELVKSYSSRRGEVASKLARLRRN